MTDESTAPPARPAPPALSITGGSPTATETAAVTVVLAALASAGTLGDPAAPRSAWSAGSRRMRPAVSAGPGAWRASALPR
jgi:hypothetical protein